VGGTPPSELFECVSKKVPRGERVSGVALRAAEAEAGSKKVCGNPGRCRAEEAVAASLAIDGGVSLLLCASAAAAAAADLNLPRLEEPPEPEPERELNECRSTSCLPPPPPLAP
jgi:hypothetical protein